MKHLVILASGNGTNAENIANYFDSVQDVRIDLIMCNKEGAGVLKRAERLNIPSVVFSANTLRNKEEFLQLIPNTKPDLIILAGFLLKIPDYLIQAFPNRIVNIHPALLPKYGGKGMYGNHVHRAVINNGESESGITIHFVNEHYDEGKTIFQAKCPVLPDDDEDKLSQRIHELEKENFPKVIHNVLQNL